MALTRVDFSVGGDSVGLDESVEATGVSVGAEVGGRILRGVKDVEEGADRAARLYLVIYTHNIYLFLFLHMIFSKGTAVKETSSSTADTFEDNS